MKTIREYKLRKDVLTCESTVFAESEDESVPWLGDYCYYVVMSAKVGPRADNLNDLQVRSKDAPRSFILNEVIRFCQTLKNMYDL